MTHDAIAKLSNMDCIRGMREHVSDDSVNLTVTSIPFEELFTYSGQVADVGNNGSTIDIRTGRFALNMRFVVAELFRVTAPGCNVCIHIQQLLAYKVQHGFMGRRDFRGAMVDAFRAGGFHFTGDFSIQKNPQAMAQRQQLHSLMFITGKRNANMLAPCPNDYVLIFQKPGQCEHPVRAIHHAREDMMTAAEFAESEIGDTYPGAYERYVEWWKKTTKDYKSAENKNGWIATDEWIRDAHGIWTDIQEIDVLDGWKAAREDSEEKHVCPLQLSVIYRLVRLYSNPASIDPRSTVLDPFMGIGSTAYVCLGGECQDGSLAYNHRRNVIGFELKESYYNQSLRNVEKARRLCREADEVEHPLFAGMGM